MIKCAHGVLPRHNNTYLNAKIASIYDEDHARNNDSAYLESKALCYL